MKEIELKKLNEKIYVDECENGLKIYMWVNERVTNYYATLNVNYGSVDTEFKIKKDTYKVPNGVAHFLEHVNFNEAENVVSHDYFAKKGTSVNAATSFYTTFYEIFGVTDIRENVIHLLDFVQKPYFTEALVEKEKGIIIEEVQMGKNQPGHEIYFGLNNILYHNDKKRYLITGEVNDVKKITQQDLETVYKYFYHPENMYLIITGNFNPYEMVAIVKENQSKKVFPKFQKPVVVKEKEDVTIVKEEQVLIGNVTIPKLRMAYKMERKAFKSIDDLKLRIYLSIILGANFGSTSDLKAKLLENALITGLDYSIEVEDNLVILTFSAETKYPNEVIKEIKNAYNNLSITNERLRRRKKVNIADMIFGMDSVEYVNSMIQTNIFNYNKVIDNIYEVIESLNIEEANEVIKEINNYNLATLIFRPKENANQ